MKLEGRIFRKLGLRPNSYRFKFLQIIQDYLEWHPWDMMHYVMSYSHTGNTCSPYVQDSCTKNKKNSKCQSYTEYSN